MQTKTMIAPSAEMIRVVTLKQGDVYKRLVDDTYGASKKKIVVGVVTDVLHNGETAALTSIEVTSSYSSVEVKPMAFGGEDDLTLYPASPKEVEAVMSEVLAVQRRKVETAEKGVEEARAVLRMVEEVTTQALTSAGTEQVQIEG